MNQRRKPCFSYRLCAASLAVAMLLHAAPARAALDTVACSRLQERGVIDATAPVGCERLAVVRFPYVDFDGRRHDDGELMVLAAIAPEVRQLFHRLYQRRFPLARARLVDHYHGDDAASMQDNNTSAFNNRQITGGGPPSLHAYGLAIDINPLQNPFVQRDGQGGKRISPPNGSAYLNRSATGAGMAEPVRLLFAEAGFTVWGGDWNTPVDYQHFQFGRAFAKRLAALPEPLARQHYLKQLAGHKRCLKKYSEDNAQEAGKRCALK